MADDIHNRVVCPYCGYRMPLEFGSDANSRGIYVRCKGQHCRREFELVIKNGKQYKHRYVYDYITGFFKSLF